MMKIVLLFTLMAGLVLNANATHKPTVRWSVEACSLTINCGNNALLVAKVKAPEHRYTIHWNTGQRSPIIKVAKSGRYIVTVKDARGTVRARDTLYLTLKRPFETRLEVRRSAVADTLVAFPQNSRLERYSYRWFRNDSLVGKGTSPFYVRLVSGVYKVEAISITGCRDFSDTVVYALPSKAIKVDFSYREMGCGGRSFTFAPLVDAEDSVISYLWDFGDGISVDFPTPSHGFEPGTYTVTLTVTTVSGRTGSVYKQFIIPPIEPWEVTIIQRPSPCGDAVELEAVTSPEADIFEWNGMPDLKKITVRTSGRYLVQVYDSCTVLHGSAYVDVVVTPAYEAEVRLVRGADGADTLVAAFAGGDAFPSNGPPPPDYFFTWYENGVQVGPGETWLVGLKQAIYHVEIASRSGCYSFSAPFYYYPSGTLKMPVVAANSERAAGTGDVRVFPNPSQGPVYLQFDKPLRKQVTIQVIDMQGHVHYTRTTLQQLQSLGLTGLPKGRYLVKITGDGEQRVRSLVVQ